MEITREGLETTTGPSDWFTGAVTMDPIATPSGSSRMSASMVRFTPGARTAWHSHPNGQTLYVVEGVCLTQDRGGTIEVVRPGDRVSVGPGEEHWHGATFSRSMAHIALFEVDEAGDGATWGDHVTDEEYRAAPSADDERDARGPGRS
jgi:quercetin dioxygenase-like cupin family protein